MSSISSVLQLVGVEDAQAQDSAINAFLIISTLLSASIQAQFRLFS